MKAAKPKKINKSKKPSPSLGDILREAREKKSLTRTELSTLFNVSQANISYIESGRIKCPNAKLLYNLSLFFNLKIEDLIMAIED